MSQTGESPKPETIIIKGKCWVCEEHKTHLGRLMSCLDGVTVAVVATGNTALKDEHIVALAKEMYVQLCLDERTRMIQEGKKDNIKEMRK